MKFIFRVTMIFALLLVAAIVANVVLKQMGKGDVSVRVEQVLDVPITTVWAQLEDHANWSRFPGIDESELVKPGLLLKNGKGAERRIRSGGFEVKEEILKYRPLTMLEYRIVESTPIKLNHEYGRITLSAELLKTRVVWESEGRVDQPLFDALLGMVVAKKVEQSFNDILASIR